MKPLLLVLLSLAFAGCDTNEDPLFYSGFYSWGFEHTGFAPCGSDEIWWTSGSGLVENYQALGVEPYQEVYAELSGLVSDKGSYGHLGAFDRDFQVTHIVRMRLGQTGDCEQNVRGSRPGDDKKSQELPYSTPR